HVMYAPPFAASAPADVGFIGLDKFVGLTTDPILVGAHHASAQLVQNLEGSLVARQTELPLELHGRHARRLAGDQIRRPEPDRERRMRALHNGAGSEARVAVAMTTPQYTGAIGKAVRLIRHATVVTDEPIAPPGALKVGCTGCLVGEQSLKLRQRAWKRQIASVKHVDNHRRPGWRRCSTYYR